MSVLVKICGLTNVDDALKAADVGADFLGFVFAESPRKIDIGAARNIIPAVRRVTERPIKMVGVFVKQADSLHTLGEVARIGHEADLDIVQLHNYSAEDCAALRGRGFEVARTFSVRDAHSLVEMRLFDVDYYLCDAWHPELAGGTGQVFDHALVKDEAARRRLILAGGLNPENVAEAVQTVRPFAVDVSSGVEGSTKRLKDHEKIERFIKNTKSALV